MRALVIVGTRPEIIKLAPVIRVGRERRDADIRVCFTGQHRETAEEAFTLFGITPDENLDIMQHDQSLNHIGRSVLGALPAVLEKVSPDIVIVQGDTSTAAFSALAAFHAGIPVAHVEAGLRSHRLDAPFPEEANRRILSIVSKYHFCPTPRAVRNLQREGVPPEQITMTGNTVVDALVRLSGEGILDDLQGVMPDVRPPFVLVTAHRRESFGAGIRNMCEALRVAATDMPHVQFIYPVHLNPHVREPVHASLEGIPNVKLIGPLSYRSLLTLLNHCAFVVTDSGGIQEEAPSFGKYCIVLREVTERMESVEQNISELVGSDPVRIADAIRREAGSPTAISVPQNPYGDGKASERIWKVLMGA